MNEQKSETFDDVPATTHDELPAQLARTDDPASPGVAMASIAATGEQARAVAEVQVMMIAALGNPRDEKDVWTRMRRTCKRATFADRAVYAFSRGGQSITGLGIKAIRELTACYRNVDYGYRELEREGDVSRVEAYAWDMEANVRVKREFWVRHARDKSGGVELVTAERDRYEVIASMAQRRVRSCLEQVLPADYLDEAMRLVHNTLRAGDGRPMEDRVRDMVIRFGELGVTEAQLEGFLLHPLRSTRPEEMPRLQQIHNSIRDGMARITDFFKAGAAPPDSDPPADPGPPGDTPPDDEPEVDPETGEVVPPPEPPAEPEPEPEPAADPAPDPGAEASDTPPPAPPDDEPDPFAAGEGGAQGTLLDPGEEDPFARK